MTTSRVLVSLGIVTALALGGCVVDTTDGEDDDAAISSVASPLGVSGGAGEDEHGIVTDDDVIDVDQGDGETGAVVDPLDAFGHEEEPDPVPWSPNKSCHDNGGKND